jgi:hypothetical protein
MQRVYWQLIAQGGVQRSAPIGLCQLDWGFFGIGHPYPGVECLLGQITKLLIHYGCTSGIGIQMQVTMELLLTELGVSLQPLQESFVTYGKWITNTWLKSVWEKVDKFNITIEIAPLPMSPPREGDKWFMQVAREAGVTDPGELVMLNRFRCHQQVLFLSDVLDAGGRRLNIKIPQPSSRP